MKADVRTHPLRLILAGIQPVLFGWAAIVVLGIFAYTLMADSPSLGSTTWQDVAGVTTGWWLTAFGGTLHFDGVSISLPPLLITLLTFLGLYFLVRRMPVADWRDTAIFVVSAGATTALLGQLAPAGSNWWLSGVGVALLAFLAILMSKNRTDWFGSSFFTSTVGRALYDGLMLSRRAVAAGLIFGLLGFIAAVIAGWSEILAINSYYIVEWHSNVLMWLFQLCYVPTFVLWALAYMIGAGFAVGAGTSFSALGVTSAPLPAIPLLGALPQPGAGTPWIIAVVVVLSFLLGVRQSRAFPGIKEAAVTGAIHVAFVAVICSLLAALAQGSIGPERLAITGPEAPVMAGLGALVLALPLYAGMLANHRTARAAYKSWWKKLRDKTGGGEVTTEQEEPAAVTSHSVSSDKVKIQQTDEAPQASNGAPGNHAAPTSTTAITAHTAPEAGRKNS
ncbi:MAG: DUF6350 family protein [Flaviflexus sp.]|uniref:cell division protein PerM n=1 Tax=Flaviflexus sp. TaxID=1969482 RepID=UPI00352C9919